MVDVDSGQEVTGVTRLREGDDAKNKTLPPSMVSESVSFTTLLREEVSNVLTTEKG